MALSSLSIRNFAIIDQTEIEFKAGLTVITGETGAGKSILLNALNLLLGARADSGMIRHGQDSCEVSASFIISQRPSVQQWLSEQDLAEDGECIIRRIVKRDSASKNYINGHPTTMTLLKQLGIQLIDLHSQHEHQSLLRKTTQQVLIDDLTSLNNPAHYEKLRELNHLYLKIKTLTAQQQESADNSADVLAKIDLLTFQARELEEASVDNNEFTQLEAEYQRLSHAKELLDGFEKAIFQLSQDDDNNAETLIGSSLKTIEPLSAFDSNLEETVSLLNSALANVQEAQANIQNVRDTTDIDPERLQWLEQRIDTLINLARKHRCTENQLASHLCNLQKTLDDLSKQAKSPADLEAEIEVLTQTYLAIALPISESRQRAAIQLSKSVTEQMQNLGMSGGQFAVNIASLPPEMMTATGLDNIEFQVSTNPGAPLSALNKTASGGELSRISLAIQVITSRSSASPTMIFDEVDVGVGGSIAEVVGARLRELGDHAQVVCITHLPQVAAQGKQHLLVEKTTNIATKKTQTDLLELNSSQRTAEIARMLGGIKITEKTLAHAQEMLKKAC